MDDNYFYWHEGWKDPDETCGEFIFSYAREKLMHKAHQLNPLSLISVGLALLGLGGACSPEDGECTCGGTKDCLALCRCSGGTPTECDRECDEPLPDAPDGATSQDDEERTLDLARLLNDVRAVGGCCEGECFESLMSLTSQAELLEAAQIHAADMAERRYVSHDTPEGISAITRIRRAGYRGCAAGENISVGDEDPRVVLDEFILSYEHCLNIYEPRFSGVGVALVGFHKQWPPGFHEDSPPVPCFA